MHRAPQSGILRASVVSAAGTTLSRLLGAARDVAIAHVFGAGRSSDAFWIAWTVPSVFRRFVADEGLTGALIPAVAQAEREVGAKAARRLAGGALAALILAGLVLCAVGMLAAPWLVQAFAFGFARDPSKLELTTALTRGLFPFVVFVSLVSYCEALLNHRRHFFIPKFAPGVVSACIGAAALLLATRFQEPAFALVVGALVGGLAHLLLCLPVLFWRWGMQLPSFRGMCGPRFRLFGREMAKVVAIGVVAQANLVFLRLLASLLEEGSVTQYWYAARIVDLAQGAVAVAVGSALLPVIAGDAAAKRWEAFRDHFAQAVRLVAAVLLPAGCFLVAMARPISAMLVLHGAFDVASMERIARTLQMMVPFMLALGGINIIKKVYFALDDRMSLLVIGTLGLLLTASAGYLLASHLGVEGLGLGLSLSGLVQLFLYVVVLRRKAGVELGMGALVSPLLKLSGAALPAGVAAYLLCAVGAWEHGPTRLTNWVVLAGAGMLASLLYMGLGSLLGVQELRRLGRRLLRRS